MMPDQKMRERLAVLAVAAYKPCAEVRYDAEGIYCLDCGWQSPTADYEAYRAHVPLKVMDAVLAALPELLDEMIADRHRAVKAAALREVADEVRHYDSRATPRGIAAAITTRADQIEAEDG